jgi:HEAT repeat protein
MTVIAKWLRKASSMFAEKPKVKADDFGMEHFLLYHGLAGSSPENQREYKDVRADILSAISRGNSQNLCINLKLAPLWWEEKLRRIFDEAKSTSLEQTLKCLLPERSGDMSELDPLSHPDWRVRANAALVLSYLGVHQAQERLIESLDATAGSAAIASTASAYGSSGDPDPSPAFCHIARALAGFRTGLARQALAKHLLHIEPWIRVDAVSALSNWPMEEIRSDLLVAFGQYHPFTDYASVALSRLHSPFGLLKSGADDLADLAATVLLGDFEGAQGPFSANAEMLPEVSVHQCLSLLLSAAEKHPSPAKLRALAALTTWLSANYHEFRLEHEGYPEPEATAQATSQMRALVEKLDIKKELHRAFDDAFALSKTNTSKTNTPANIDSKARHAIKLAGEQKISAAVPVLLELLSSQPLYRDDIVEALGAIEDPQSQTILIEMARKLVDIEKRTDAVFSANPIVEDDAAAAKTYWFILRALGHLPGDKSLAFLLDAVKDEASDKREEALNSLTSLHHKASNLARMSEVKEAVSRALSDPSAQVRVRAAEAAVELGDASLVAPLAKLINAQEMSVSRAAFNALEQLAAKGHKQEIAAALGEAKQGQTNSIKVKRIDEFIQHHLQ